MSAPAMFVSRFTLNCIITTLAGIWLTVCDAFVVHTRGDGKRYKFTVRESEQ